MKKMIKVVFINSHGIKEPANGNGVMKEYISELAKFAFAPERGCFSCSSENDGVLIPTAKTSDIEEYQFLGTIVGKALYENIAIEPVFSIAFLNKILSNYNYFFYLRLHDEQVYRSLIEVKNYAGNLQDLGLTFSVTERTSSRYKTVNLMSNGDNISVSIKNRKEYIHLRSKYVLNTQMTMKCNAFVKGLCSVVSLSWLRMFSPNELQLLMNGNMTIDVNEWKEYSNLKLEENALETEKYSRWFWGIVKEMDITNQRRLLKFATSCSRPPISGFKALSPEMKIRIVPENDLRFPTSSTCFNLIKMPMYSSQEIMKKKLYQAIESCTGFQYA